MTETERIKNIATASLVLMLALASFLSISFFASDQASAARTCTWDGGDVDDDLASSPDNWDTNTAPIAGDSILFDATSTDPCTWNLALALVSFTVANGYTGTITNAATFSLSNNFTPCYTGSTFIGGTYSYSVGGNYDSHLGTATMNTATIVMTGNGKTIQMVNSYAARIGALSLIGGTITMASSFYLATYATISLTSSILNMANHTINIYIGSNIQVIQGSGSITTGSMNFQTIVGIRTMSISSNVALGINLYVWDNSGAATFKFGSDIMTTGSFNAYKTVGLTVNTNGYNLTCNDFVLINGATLQTQSPITITDNWNGANGTFTSGTSGVHFTGASGTIYANTNRFYNMMIETGASTTMQTDVYVSGYFWNNGTFSKGGHMLYLNHDQAPTYSTSPITTADFEDAYAYDANASDQENLGLTYALTTDHPTAVIDDETGEVTTPGAVGNGTWSMDISVTDGNHTVYQNYSLAAENNEYPDIFSHPGHTVTEAVEYWYHLNATDPEGYDLTYNMTTDAYWLGAIDEDGYFYGTPGVGEAGAWSVNISVDDGYRMTWQNWTIEVISAASQTFTPGMVFGTVLAFGTVGMGLFRREFLMLAGLIWILVGIYFLGDIHIIFTILSLGIGFILLMTTAVDYLETSEKNRHIGH